MLCQPSDIEVSYTSGGFLFVLSGVEGFFTLIEKTTNQRRTPWTTAHLEKIVIMENFWISFTVINARSLARQFMKPAIFTGGLKKKPTKLRIRPTATPNQCKPLPQASLAISKKPASDLVAPPPCHVLHRPWLFICVIFLLCDKYVKFL